VVGLSAGDVNERPLSRAATEIPRVARRCIARSLSLHSLAGRSLDSPRKSGKRNTCRSSTGMLLDSCTRSRMRDSRTEILHLSAALNNHLPLVTVITTVITRGCASAMRCAFEDRPCREDFLADLSEICKDDAGEADELCEFLCASSIVAIDSYAVIRTSLRGYNKGEFSSGRPLSFCVLSRSIAWRKQEQAGRASGIPR